MKFYDRKNEISILSDLANRTKNIGLLTVMIGRRRIGKTTLLTNYADENVLYLYVSKDNERVLTAKFQEAAQGIGLQIFGKLESFAHFFELLMKYGVEHHFTVVFDEFQNFLSVNPAIIGHIQDIWDRYHNNCKVHFIACGSVYSMMQRIFDSGNQPLYGRQDCRIVVKPFTTTVLKQILADYNPNFTSEDLLCLYTLTGGVAKYVAWLMDANATTQPTMIDFVTRSGSPFLSEGTELIMSEFGRDYANYLSILQLIASGYTTQSEIDSVIGKNTGAYLTNLSNQYSYIRRHQPMFSKPNSRNSRWTIDDCFLRFWFRFIVSNQALVEMGRNDMLREILMRDYLQFSGLLLEQYFRQKISEEQRVTKIGSYWDRRGENEIDVIALNSIDHTATIAEVKRQSARYDYNLLKNKVLSIKKQLSGYEIKLLGLSLEDM